MGSAWWQSVSTRTVTSMSLLGSIELGGLLGSLTVAADAGGYARLWQWASELG